MEISLSRQQFEALLKVVYLGDWMVNAIRASGSYIPEFEDLDQFLLSLGHRSGFEDVVEFEPVLSQFFLKDEVYEKLQPYIDEYDDEAFWDGLSTGWPNATSKKRTAMPSSGWIRMSGSKNCPRLSASMKPRSRSTAWNG